MLRRSAMLLSFVVPLLVPAMLPAQSEAALRRYFEGRTVTLRLDMPGTDEGVDLHPGTGQPLDYPRYAARLKEYGTAIRSGESAMITKIKVKEKLIEFQLGGGGFGTFGDDDDATVSVSATPKSRREKDLEKTVKAEPDPARRRELQRELDDLREDREREDRRNRSAAATASEQKRANVRQRRLDGGSRFNLRFADGVPRTALTPDAIVDALEKYVAFPSETTTGGDAAGPTTPPASGPIRVGMLVREVDSALGTAARIEERMEGKYRVSVRTYETGDRRIVGEFVEGVLVSLTSERR